MDFEEAALPLEEFADALGTFGLRGRAAYEGSLARRRCRPVMPSDRSASPVAGSCSCRTPRHLDLVLVADRGAVEAGPRARCSATSSICACARSSGSMIRARAISRKRVVRCSRRRSGQSLVSRPSSTILLDDRLFAAGHPEVLDQRVEPAPSRRRPCPRQRRQHAVGSIAQPRGSMPKYRCLATRVIVFSWRGSARTTA